MLIAIDTLTKDVHEEEEMTKRCKIDMLLLVGD